MERDFGAEIVNAFGLRLQRIYELDETALPPQMAQWLERLRIAEIELTKGPEQSPPPTQR